VGEAVADKPKLALLDVLLDGVKKFLFTDLDLKKFNQNLAQSD
jgi:hypothetical protein